LIADQQRQREETDIQKQGASPTKIQDQSGREPNAQEVAKAQDITAPNFRRQHDRALAETRLNSAAVSKISRRSSRL